MERRTRKLWAPVSLASLLLVPASWAKLPREQALQNRNYDITQWNETVLVEDDRFQVYTTLSEKRAREVLRICNLARERFLEFFKSQKNLQSHSSKIRVLFFPNREDWQKFTLQRDGNTPDAQKTVQNNAGYYSPHDEAIVIYETPKANTVLMHEITHCFLALYGGVRTTGGNPWTAWFHEGIATYMEEGLSGAEFDGKRVNAGRIKETLEWVEKAPAGQKFETLFKSKPDDFHNEGNGKYYAAAYSFIMFLDHARGGKYRELFTGENGVMGRARRGQPMEVQNLSQMFGEKFRLKQDQIEGEWTEFLKAAAGGKLPEPDPEEAAPKGKKPKKDPKKKEK